MAVISSKDCAASRTPGRLIRRLDRTMSAVLAARFDDLDLTYFQWIALKVVADGIVTTAGELARELGITAGATSRMVDALEARGLIERGRGDDDRRVVRLAITPAGRRVTEQLMDRAVEAWNELLADVDQNEADRVVEILSDLVGVAERMWSAADARGDALTPAAARAEAVA